MELAEKRAGKWPKTGQKETEWLGIRQPAPGLGFTSIWRAVSACQSVEGRGRLNREFLTTDELGAAIAATKRSADSHVRQPAGSLNSRTKLSALRFNGEFNAETRRCRGSQRKIS